MDTVYNGVSTTDRCLWGCTFMLDTVSRDWPFGEVAMGKKFRRNGSIDEQCNAVGILLIPVIGPGTYTWTLVTCILCFMNV